MCFVCVCVCVCVCVVCVCVLSVCVSVCVCDSQAGVKPCRLPCPATPRHAGRGIAVLLRLRRLSFAFAASLHFQRRPSSIAFVSPLKSVCACVRVCVCVCVFIL